MPASVPQFGQKRMVSGIDPPQLAQECVMDCAMVFSLSIKATGDNLTDVYKLERLDGLLS